MAEPTSRTERFVVATVAVLATGLLLAASTVVTLDGTTHEGWRMLGRFHPVVVHFPIALLLLVPLFDAASASRPAWRAPATTVLWLGTAGAYAAAFAGLALAYADGHSGGGLSRHLWGGVAVAIIATIACVLRSFHLQRITCVVSLILIGTLGWAAHQGANLTHGESYLSEGLPAAVQRFFGIKGADDLVQDRDTVFGAAVTGTLEAHCVSCHGAQKQKGNYRVDAFDAMIAGGQSGRPAIVPNSAGKSELMRRMRLPVTDRKVMPPRGRPRPTKAELQLLDWWVAHGASRELTLAEARRRDAAAMNIIATVMQESGRDWYVTRVGDYSHLSAQMRERSLELGVSLVPVSKRTGDGLILRCRNQESSFSNATLAALAPFAPFIVEADLGGTRIDDEGITGLAGFTQLVTLNIERTEVSGATLSQLAHLPELMMINLCNSRLDDAGLKQAVALGSLRKLHTLGSAVTEAGLRDFSAARPDCETP